MEQDDFGDALLAAGMASQGSYVQERPNPQFRIRFGLGQGEGQLLEHPSFWESLARGNEHVSVSGRRGNPDSAYRAQHGRLGY